MAVNWQRGVLRMMRVANHRVTVLSVADLTPWYRRIVFSAPEFVRSLDVFPTLWVRLWVPDPRRGDGYVSQRGYTLVDVRPDAGTFGLDFVLHEARGPAGDWARGASPGDELEVAVTPARISLPDGTTTVILAGDATAIPAINSWLSHITGDVAVHAFVEDSHDDREDLPLIPRDGAKVHWLPAGEPRGSALATAIAEAFRPGDGLYAWAAGEKTLVKSVRTVLREHLALDRQHHFTQFYWIHGKAIG